jgi:hypothetical protein
MKKRWLPAGKPSGIYFKGPMSSLILAEYLDETESKTLGERLREADVAVAIKRHGLPRFFGVEINYKVIVDAEDIDKAKPVFERFSAEVKKNRADRIALQTSRCPWCASKNIAQREKKDLWQRFRFYGVAVWRCNDCGGGWYV